MNGATIQAIIAAIVGIVAFFVPDVPKEALIGVLVWIAGLIFKVRIDLGKAEKTLGAKFWKK